MSQSACGVDLAVNSMGSLRKHEASPSRSLESMALIFIFILENLIIIIEIMDRRAGVIDTTIDVLELHIFQ